MKSKWKWKPGWKAWTAGLLIILLTAGAVLAAAGPAITQWVVGAGGGKVEGGGLVLHSAIGQPAAGTVSNGLRLCSGYLCGEGDLWQVYLPLVIR
jgi:hypothetical protein